MQKKKNLFIVFVLIGLLFVVGTSYALWQLTLIQTESNLVNTTCFKIAFKDENAITLQNSYPITDEEGMSLTPYTFTIENICDTNATYQINLENLRVEGKELNDEYLKLSLNEEKEKILNTLPEVSPTIPNADVSHKLTTGVLKAGEKKEFFLRLWMDEDTPPIDEVMNATHESKVTVTLIHKETIPEVTTLASEYLDGISVQNTVSNLGNENLTYFYQLDGGEEIESSDANYTFTGLNDGTYHVGIRIENQDGIIIKEETKDVVIAYEHVYVSSSGNDTTGIGSMENPYATLQHAYNKVKSGGEVLLLSNITATSTTNMNIENKSVTLKSSGENSYSIFRGETLKTAVIDMDNTNTLTTTHITLDGKNISANSSLIECKFSNLNLNEKTIIQNNENNGKIYTEQNNWASALGGGIYVWHGNLKIDKATIRNNKVNYSDNSQGGGIAFYYGTLTFNDGLITNNTQQATEYGGGGGIFAALDVKVYIRGGEISYNTANTQGGGITIYEEASESVMEMTGGKIIQNTALNSAGGIHVSKPITSGKATVYLKGGTIANNTSPTGSDTYAINGAQIIDQR